MACSIQYFKWWRIYMMTSSNGSIFRVTGHLCGEFTGPRWIPRTKASDADFDVFFDLSQNKWLSEAGDLWGWWFETPPCPLWRHSNGHSCRFVNNLNWCQARNKGSLCQTLVKTMFLMGDIFHIKLDLPIHFPLTITKPTKQLHTASASVELLVVHTCSQAWFSQAGNIEK